MFFVFCLARYSLCQSSYLPRYGILIRIYHRIKQHYSIWRSHPLRIRLPHYFPLQIHHLIHFSTTQLTRTRAKTKSDSTTTTSIYPRPTPAAARSSMSSPIVQHQQHSFLPSANRASDAHRKAVRISPSGPPISGAGKESEEETETTTSIEQLFTKTR